MSLTPLTGSGLLTETEIDTAPAEPGDHDKFAHYAQKYEITEALVNGTPIVALCGKVWVPTRDPKGFSVCPECKEIYAELNSEEF